MRAGYAQETKGFQRRLSKEVLKLYQKKKKICGDVGGGFVRST